MAWKKRLEGLNEKRERERTSRVKFDYFILDKFLRSFHYFMSRNLERFCVSSFITKWILRCWSHNFLKHFSRKKLLRRNIPRQCLMINSIRLHVFNIPSSTINEQSSDSSNICLWDRVKFQPVGEKEAWTTITVKTKNLITW